MANPASIENFGTFSMLNAKDHHHRPPLARIAPQRHPVQCPTGKAENPANPSSLKDLFRIQG